MTIAENVAGVREKIASAALRSGRQPEAVTLVAVCKYVDVATTRQLIAAGCHDLGEARPQQLWQKLAQLADTPVRWHLVGHLQTNKVRRTLPHVHLIQSIDSTRLLDAVNEHAHALGRRALVLLEVNISGDATKHGFDSTEMPSVIDQAERWPAVEIRGLMGMAALEGDQGEAQRNFASLRRLRDALAVNCPASVRLDELSMGMSGDYEAAIEEGATLVRVGSALFEGIE